MNSSGTTSSGPFGRRFPIPLGKIVCVNMSNIKYYNAILVRGTRLIAMEWEDDGYVIVYEEDFTPSGPLPHLFRVPHEILEIV